MFRIHNFFITWLLVLFFLLFIQSCSMVEIEGLENFVTGSEEDAASKNLGAFTRPVFKSFDFGTLTSGLALESERVTEATLYSAGGYGWLDTKDLESIDRGRGCLVSSDVIYSNQSKTFRAEIENGTYILEVLLGDRELSFTPSSGPSPFHFSMTVKANNKLVSSKTRTIPGMVASHYYTITIDNGLLDLEFSTNQPVPNTWSVNGFKLYKTDADNKAPSVLIGPASTVTLPDNSVKLTGSAIDDGLPLLPGKITYTWSQVAGPGGVTFEETSSAKTTAYLTTPGIYTLRLTADDGNKIGYNDVNVTLLQSIDEITTGEWYIVNEESLMAIGPEGGSKNNGATIRQTANKLVDQYKWTFTALGGGIYSITSSHSGKVLDLVGKATTNGVNLCQQDYTGDDSQKWEIIDTGKGSFIFKNVKSGRYLAIPWGNCLEGSRTIIWDATGNYDQNFILLRAES